MSCLATSPSARKAKYMNRDIRQLICTCAVHSSSDSVVLGSLCSSLQLPCWLNDDDRTLIPALVRRFINPPGTLHSLQLPVLLLRASLSTLACSMQHLHCIVARVGVWHTLSSPTQKVSTARNLLCQVCFLNLHSAMVSKAASIASCWLCMPLVLHHPAKVSHTQNLTLTDRSNASNFFMRSQMLNC